MCAFFDVLYVFATETLMDYLSEVLKIIEGATKANASMASN